MLDRLCITRCSSIESDTDSVSEDAIDARHARQTPYHKMLQTLYHKMLKEHLGLASSIVRVIILLNRSRTWLPISMHSG